MKKSPNVKGKPQVICDKLNEYHVVRKFIIKYPNIEDYFNTEFKERKIKFGAGKR